jgi:small subunit ribosomal protein S6
LAEKMYEGMFLLDSARFSSDPEGTTNEVLGILTKAGAIVAVHRPWQDGRLAYEIEGTRRGTHYLAYFRMDGSGVTDITRSVKLSETVLRHLIILQPQSLFDAMVEALGSHDPEAQARAAEEQPREERPRRRRQEEESDEGDLNE